MLRRLDKVITFYNHTVSKRSLIGLFHTALLYDSFICSCVGLFDSAIDMSLLYGSFIVVFYRALMYGSCIGLMFMALVLVSFIGLLYRALLQISFIILFYRSLS